MRKGLFRLSQLAVAMLCLQPVSSWALQKIDDEHLRHVTGQDGIDVTLQQDKVTMDNLYLENQTGAGTTRRVQANGVTITPVGSSSMTTELKIQTGANAGVPALNIQGTISPHMFNANALQICQSDGVTCGATLGQLTTVSTQNILLGLTTTNGIFNDSGTTTLRLTVPDLQAYITHNLWSGSSIIEKNQLAADLRMDLLAVGRLWIDGTSGIRFSTLDKNGSSIGAISLNGNGTQSGLDLSLYTRNNAAITASPYSLNNAKGLLRLGLTGNMLNSDLYLRGFNDNSGFFGSSVMGSGLALRLKTDLAGANDANPFTMDLTEAGANGYGLRFTNMVGFSDPTKRASLDTGNVYIGVVDNSTARTMTLPVNTTLTSAALNPSTTLATSSDFNQTMVAGKDAVMVALRGMSLQAVPTRTMFVSSTGTPINSQTQYWSIAPLLYGVNGNIALYGDTGTEGTNTRERIGFNLGLTTTGRDATGSNTTSILLVDTGTNNGGLGNYIGLRNIDSLVSAQGSLELRNNALRLNFPKLLIAAAGDLAIGCLPNRPCAAGTAAANNFATNRDTLMGFRLRLQGLDNAGNYIELVGSDPSSASSNYLGLNADLTLTNSYLQLVEPATNARIGLDNISGRIKLDNGRVDFQNNSGVGAVSLQGHVTINPNCPTSGSLSGCTSPDVQALKVGSIDLYPSATAQPQALASAVMTGGKIFTNLTLTPRN